MSQPDVSLIATELEGFLRKRFRIKEQDPAKFNHRVNLWEAGYVDSLGTVEVINYLEDRFQVKLPGNTMFGEANTTIEGLASLVHSTLPAAR
jgi:acyl carrier protein